jgi:catechol 2,3-dioxygenase-like lactoylglutathione lyase family enzyme
MTFSVYLQVANLGRSLTFYRDGLGLEVTWNDDVLAVLRGPGQPAGLLVIRQVGTDASRGLGHAGVTRIGWQVTSLADLDSAEERLAQNGAQYQRPNDTNGKRITTRDPDGLEFVVFLPPEPSPAEKPPPFVYWYH